MLNEEQQAQIEKLQIRNQELKEALELAITILESYEFDIRHSKRMGVDLVERGFCQGRIYRGAVPLIKRKAKLPLDEEEMDILRRDWQ